MTTDHQATLAIVIDTIRRTIDEDWIHDFEIDEDTRFSDDLEIESIEFIKIADAIQQRFGKNLNISAWLLEKNLQQLIALSVGELTQYVAAHTA